MNDYLPGTGTPPTDYLPRGGEVRSVSTTGGEKGTKLARYDLLPVGALRQVAEHYGKGASKYADHNWRRGYEWSKSYAALMRHATQFWSGEDIDEETGSHHMAAVAFHALALLEYAESHPDFDDRYRPAPSQADIFRACFETPGTHAPDCKP
jgi:hypothetical protein